MVDDSNWQVPLPSLTICDSPVLEIYKPRILQRLEHPLTISIKGTHRLSCVAVSRDPLDKLGLLHPPLEALVHMWMADNVPSKIG